MVCLIAPVTNSSDVQDSGWYGVDTAWTRRGASHLSATRAQGSASAPCPFKGREQSFLEGEGGAPCGGT
eukprot:6858691-Pyramimonas_sp.AAC.1